LEKYQPIQNINQPNQQPNDIEYYPPEQYQEQYEQQYQQTPLAQEYDRLQERAIKYQKDLETIEATNPHTLYKDIVTKPSPKRRYPMTILGRPIDFAKLENYLVYKISPRTITTLIRYGDARAIEDIKGYSKKRPIRFKGGIIWIILGAFIILILGWILLTQDLSGFFQGMFGV